MLFRKIDIWKGARCKSSYLLIVNYIPWNRAMEGPGCLGWNPCPVFVGRELCRGAWASFANGIHFQDPVLQGWKKGEENRPQTAW